MGNLPLEGLKVVDIAVLFASPTISQNMGDFGAEVIKVEHPKSGDSLRSLGAAKDGIPLWWKITNRNKKCVTLDLSKHNRPGAKLTGNRISQSRTGKRRRPIRLTGNIREAAHRFG